MHKDEFILTISSIISPANSSSAFKFRCHFHQETLVSGISKQTKFIIILNRLY